LNYEEARRLARSWCEAWSKGDLDAVMGHYAVDVKFSSPTVDVIELDANGKGKVVQAFYGEP
jgi:ketosteroid isomerase-like protein